MDFNLSLGAFSVQRNVHPLDEGAVYDVMILGGGPAGLTAAVYCMRKGVSTAMIVRQPGGQVAETAEIENYMGYRHISGVDLSERFKEQVLQFGLAYEEGSAVSSVEDGAVKKTVMEDGRVFRSRTLVVATGKSWRRLGVPGESEFVGRGVAFCVTCDGPFYAGRKVIVVGGGNSGVEAALELARIASGVTLVQFLDELTADRILVDRLMEQKNVDMLFGHEIVRIAGDQSVSGATVRERKSGAERDIEAQGVFVEIGLIPNSGPLTGVVDLNEHGEIVVDCACNTSAPGIFAAGDVTTVPFKQIIIAGGEGAKAALSACEYLLKQ
jgi:alkyl hydroperoxide reductase subunit F